MSARGLKYLVIVAVIAVLFIPVMTVCNAQQTQQDLSQDYNKVLFSDDFEHGTGNWELADTWHINTDGNNSYLVGDYGGDISRTNWVIWAPPGLGPVHLRLVNFDNYTFEAGFKLDSGMVSFNYRDINQPSYPPNPHYSVQVSRTGNDLVIDINKNGAIKQPVYTNAQIPGADGWHKIEITGRGTEIQVKLDGKLVITYIDNNDPYLSGAAAFEITPGTQVAVDNIRLLGGADTTVSDTRYLAVSGVLLVLIVMVSGVLGLNYYLKKRRNSRQAQIRSKLPVPEAQADKNSVSSAANVNIEETRSSPPIDIKKVLNESDARVVGQDVFISYSHEDKPTADTICAELEAEGIKCWIAPRDVLPGAIFQEAIIDAIDSSSLMVMVYSARSNSSPHVVRELSRAVSQEVTIIPFRIEDVPLSKSMEYLISVPHWLDAITPPMEKHIKELVQVVKVNLEIKRKKAN